MTEQSHDLDSSQVRTSWRSSTEPWYFSYGLLGISAAGLAPILLPLAVGRQGDLTKVGLVMAVFSLGGLLAPLWGGLADRRHCYRLILIGGLVTTALGFALFPFSSSLSLQLFLAFAQGAGAVAAATVGNMLIVEAHPREEWDKRIGWLQTFYGVGQVGGLLLAGIMSQINMTVSLLAAGAVTMLAILPASGVRPRALTQITPRPILVHPPRHTELSAGSPQRFHHHLGSSSLEQILQPLFSRFGGFLVAWFLSFAGAAGFFSLYPVLMRQAYGVSASLSSTAFAVAAWLGLALYAPAGKWSGRHGALPVLEAGLGVRWLAFAGLFVLGSAGMTDKSIPALAGFLFIVLAWSLLSVTGTAVTVRLARSGEGEALGLFNATTAIAGVVGSALGGWLASRWGYTAVPAMGVAGITLGILILLGTVRKKGQPQDSSTLNTELSS